MLIDMEENKKLIIVPWDFTNVAESALAHAAKISRMIGSEICLLHIVDPGIKVKAEGEKKILLRHVAEENSRKYNLNIVSEIVKGSIFTSIAEFANSKDKEASLVVMGTHGMKGMQKLTGSWALVHMKGRGEKNWLLIKHRDEAARPGASIVTEAPDSVATGRSIDQIAVDEMGVS